MPSLVSRPTTSFFNFPFRKNKYVYELNPPDETYSVTYLGNVLTSMGKGEASVQKPLNVIWKTYNSKRTKCEISMKLCVTRSGLKADTKQGTTEYWANRVTYCAAPTDYPRIFCWVYKHEGKRMKPDLRCHAVLCRKTTDPAHISSCLNNCRQAALLEYKREKLMIEKSRKSSLCGGIGPRRKIMLQTGSLNFRTLMFRSKSAPRLGSIDEEDEDDKCRGDEILQEGEEDDEEGSDIDSMSYHNTPNFTDSSSDCSTVRRTKRNAAALDALSIDDELLTDVASTAAASINSTMSASSSPPTPNANGTRCSSNDVTFQPCLTAIEQRLGPLAVHGGQMPQIYSEFSSSCPAVSNLEMAVTAHGCRISDDISMTQQCGSLGASSIGTAKAPGRFDRDITDFIDLNKLRFDRQNSLDDSRVSSSNSASPDQGSKTELPP